MGTMKYLGLLFCSLVLSGVCASQKAPVGLAGSGNAFLRYCEGVDEPTALGMCRGYVMGISDGLLMVHSSFSNAICPPEHQTAEQLYRIVVKYMREHPEETHKFTSVLVFEAQAAAFPCQANK
jgi:hypothetical protein